MVDISQSRPAPSGVTVTGAETAQTAEDLRPVVVAQGRAINELQNRPPYEHPAAPNLNIPFNLVKPDGRIYESKILVTGGHVMGQTELLPAGQIQSGGTAGSGPNITIAITNNMTLSIDGFGT